MPELVGRFEGTAFETPAPAFLVGFPRSGTTMTEQVIDPGSLDQLEDRMPLCRLRSLHESLLFLRR